MTDDEFRGLISGRDGMTDALWEMDEDHRTQDVPTHTALFTRGFPTYTETMWIHAYVNARVIVVTHPGILLRDRPGKTMPGVIREIPVGRRDVASAETFLIRFLRVVESLTREGWVRKPHTVEQEI